MKNKPVEKKESRSKEYLLIFLILLAALSLRLAGIWRAEPIDYHPDEDKIARPVFLIANECKFEMKRDYNWPICGVIYPLGYSLYGLKEFFGPYSYGEILVTQRVLSGIVGTISVWIIYLFVRKLFNKNTALIAACFAAAAKLGVNLDHEGLFRGLVSFITFAVMWLAYDIFENSKEKPKEIKLRKCILTGVICGWGTATWWSTALLIIPLSASFLLSLWNNRKSGNWKDFFVINIKRIIIIAAAAIIMFLVSIPDFLMSPDKVLSGMSLHQKQGKVGHYGAFSDRSDSIIYKVEKLSENMSNAGSVYLVLIGLAAFVYCLLRPSKAVFYLMWTIILWLIVIHSSVLPLERYYLVPFIIMLIFISIMFGRMIESIKSSIKITGKVLLAAVLLISVVYTLIFISPQWKPDARLLCSRWIKENVPVGSGVTWAPRTHKWMAPGIVVDPDLFAKFPQQAAAGKEQYVIAAKSVMDVFKKHPPGEKINPDDWFPSQPPSPQELVLYYEMNQGSGAYIQKVMEFNQKASFLGLDLRLFFQDPNIITTCANWPVTIFKISIKK